MKRTTKRTITSLTTKHLTALLFFGLAGHGSTARAQSPGTFTATANGWTAGYGSTATLLPDGRVLLVDGPSAALYDPKTGTFAPTAGSRTYSSTWQSATLLPDGRVLFAGGLLDQTYPTSQSEIFDPSTGAFTLGPGLYVFRQDLPQRRSAEQRKSADCRWVPIS